MSAELPNLFILGAPKCGTTALAQWLALHPEICAPKAKEPHHFSNEYCLTPDREAYLALYAHRSARQRWAFDASVWSLFSSSAVRNILAEVPHARFIAMVRNPLELIPSLHRQETFNGNELEPDLRTALRLDERRSSGQPISVSRGHPPEHLAYFHSCALGRQVDRLLDLISADKLHIVVFDDLRSNPASVLTNVYRFLDLQPQLPPTFEHVNVAKIRPFPGVSRAVKRIGDMKHRLGIKPRLGVLAWLSRLNRKEQTIAPLDADIRDEILNRLERDIELLSTRIDRDLSAWCKRTAHGNEGGSEHLEFTASTHD